MTCEFTQDAGSYVLGALSADDRAAYRSHVTGCPVCTQATLELAGLPGLLARVSQDVLESPGENVPSGTLLPGLVQEARGIERRRTRRVVGMAAAVVIMAIGALATVLALDDDAGTIALPSPGVTATAKAMVPVGSEPMSASVALTSVGWGTRLDLTCSYPATSYGSDQDDFGYVMFVRTRDGRLEQVASWRAHSGKTMRLTAATAAIRDDITSVEIRTASGEPVLKLVS
jgi:hypothetical protein